MSLWHLRAILSLCASTLTGLVDGTMSFMIIGDQRGKWKPAKTFNNSMRINKKLCLTCAAALCGMKEQEKHVILLQNVNVLRYFIMSMKQRTFLITLKAVWRRKFSLCLRNTW